MLTKKFNQIKVDNMNQNNPPPQEIIQENLLQLISCYGNLIPDHDQLLSTLLTPLPTTAWCNPLKCPENPLEDLSLHHDIEPLPWWNLGFRFKGDYALGKTWHYLCGLIQIQEEVSMLPTLILNPQPGDRVLDLCAAPGNKTAQAATLMKNQGQVFANDANLNRLRATGQIIKRLGLSLIHI